MQYSCSVLLYILLKQMQQFRATTDRVLLATRVSCPQYTVYGPKVFESAHEPLVFIALSSNEGLGESVHMHRLSKAYIKY